MLGKNEKVQWNRLHGSESQAAERLLTTAEESSLYSAHDEYRIQQVAGVTNETLHQFREDTRDLVKSPLRRAIAR